jgi:hypothetical protein
LPDFKFVSTFIIGRHPDRSDVRVIAVVVGPEEICLVDLARVCCSKADSVEVNGLASVHDDEKSAEGYQDQLQRHTENRSRDAGKDSRASGSHHLA